MNRTTKFLAPASLAISVHFPKVYLQAIPHHYLHIGAKASFLLSPKTCLSAEEKFKKLRMDSSSVTPHVSECDLKTDEMTKSFQKVSLINKIRDVNLNTDFSESSNMKFITEKMKYKEIRKWQQIKKETRSTVTKGDTFILKILSFNILAQNLLETHDYLYKNHDKQFLSWEKRKPLIVNEILEADANIICLQEMQEDHLQEFLDNFKSRNYSYLYKKRTSDKKDGLLLLYKEDLFKLLEFSKVELYQTDIELLSRDNVGIVAKFSLKESPETKFVIATTHLLFNPRRNDVRLGQVQILLAEIERIAFEKSSALGPEYLPVVLSGDFNLEPYSGVYKFLVEGSIEYAGKGKNLEPCDYKCLSKSLIPPSLHVTDECQHFNVLAHRLSGKSGGKIMLRNTESQENVDSKNEKMNNEDFPKQSFNSRTTDYQKVEVAKGHFVTFSSGLLTHPFQFRSVYNHKNTDGKNEATTFQNRWVTVDFIFYSKIEPVENYCLPSVDDCKSYFPTIPNSIVGSDHFCLGSTFKLLKKR